MSKLSASENGTPKTRRALTTVRGSCVEMGLGAHGFYGGLVVIFTSIRDKPIFGPYFGPDFMPLSP